MCSQSTIKANLENSLLGVHAPKVINITAWSFPGWNTCDNLRARTKQILVEQQAQLMQSNDFAGDLQWQLYDMLKNRNEWWVPGKLVELRQRLEGYWRVRLMTQAVLRFAMLCCAVLCCAVLCYAMYAMVHPAVLCCGLLHCAVLPNFSMWSYEPPASLHAPITPATLCISTKYQRKSLIQ